MPCTDVVAKLWDYIRQHALLDPQNGREIRADKSINIVSVADDSGISALTLRAAIKRSEVRGTGVRKVTVLSPHEAARLLAIDF